MNHAAITKAIHSRGTFSVAVVINAIATALAYAFADDSPVLASAGFVSGWGNAIALPKGLCLVAAMALNAAIVSLMLYTNKIYNLLRTMTQLHGALFLIFLLATPATLYSLYPGSILCLGVTWCLALMYMVYALGGEDTRKVFLVFFILSAGASFNYAFAIYIPIFILSCFQLRIFSMRCALAILIGLLTPWIIFFGFGLVQVSQLQVPFEPLRLPSLSDTGTAILSSTVLLTAFIAIGALLQNVFKIITYNGQSRSMLSVITTITIITVICSVIDTANIYSYITLLYLCAAFQVAHLFVAILNFAKSYIAIFCIVLIYLLIFAWNLVTYAS